MAPVGRLTEKLRRDALQIFHAALAGADAARLVRKAVSVRGSVLQVRLRRISPARGQLYVFGAGKAAAVMAHALEEEWGGSVAGGLVIVKPGYVAPLRRVRVLAGSHPQPNTKSVRATEQLLGALRKVTCDDHVLFVWSGGASSLLFQPREGITSSQKISALSMLMNAGADIRQLNTVRKHLSAVKGGQLLRSAPGVSAISLVLSDVCGDHPATIASGPTFPDHTTFGEAIEILKRYGIWKRSPFKVRALLRAGQAGEIPENPRPGDPLFHDHRTLLIGTSENAIAAAARHARRLGYRTRIIARQLQGDTVDAAHLHAAVATALEDRTPCCLLSGGETTLRLVARRGSGGRNQHFTLATAMLLAKSLEMNGRCYVVLSAGTDGTDGPTDAAGAIADDQTQSRCRQCGLDPEKFLRRQDSYTFFRKLGDLVCVGPTKTNVMDVRIILVAPATFE
ncbi:MAG: DUF4147 domain-containing protein [Acidobacteria bacterium]|nr:DUF4147 domain-containing protein [Acidobacteriota bacterium]